MESFNRAKRSKCGQSNSHSAGDYSNSAIIYPNPTGNELTIRDEALKIELFSIYNVLGKEISFGQSPIQNPEFEIKINVSSLATAIYFLHLQFCDGIRIIKFV